MFVHHACMPCHDIMLNFFPDFIFHCYLDWMGVHLHIHTYIWDRSDSSRSCLCVQALHMFWGQNEQKGCSLQEPALQLTYDCRARAFFFKAVSASDLQRDHRHSSAPLRGTRLIGQEPRETGKSPRNFSDKQHWTTWQSSRTVPWVQYSGCIIDVWWDIHCFDIFGLQYRDHMFLPEIAVVIPPSQLT